MQVRPDLIGRPSEATDSDRQQTPVRCEWLAIAKGIGLFIVIYLHATWEAIAPWNAFFSGFAMPLFFVIAGLTYDNEKYRHNMRVFAVTRARRYLIPYVILFTMWIGLVTVAPGSGTDQNATQLLFWFAYGNGPPSGSPHLWFLPTLYFGLILFMLVDRVTKDLPAATKWVFAVVFPLITVALHSLFSTLWPYLVPWRIGAMFVAATFILVGNEIRRYLRLRAWTVGSLGLDLLSVLGAALALFMVCQINGFTDIAMDNIGNVWLYLTTGLLGTYIVFVISALVVQYGGRVREFMTRVGTFSQELYEIHPMFLYTVPLLLGLVGVVVTNPIAAASSLWPLNYLVMCAFSIPLVFYVVPRHGILRLVFRGSTRADRTPTPAPS